MKALKNLQDSSFETPDTRQSGFIIEYISGISETVSTLSTKIE